MTKAISIFWISLFFTGFCLAQNQKVQIKIESNINGEKISIDTIINQLDDFDLNDFLQQAGIEEELDQLEIDITDGRIENFDFNFNEDALNSLLENIEKIEIPEMPEMPEMPAVLPFENFTFFNGNKAYLGVTTEKSKNPDGVVILEVMENTAAFEAGLNKGDIIQMVGNKTVESPNNLVEILSDYEPNQKVSISYLRDGNANQTEATLKENKAYIDEADWNSYEDEMKDWGEKFAEEMKVFSHQMEESWPDSSNQYFEERGFLGVVINDMDNEPGIIISEIVKQSAAEEAGLKAGDIINTINDQVIQNYSELSLLISSLKPGEVVGIQYTRDGKKETINATLKSNKNGTFNYNWNNDGGENIQSPCIKIYSCPPSVNSYSYCLDGNKKSIKMSIKVINDSNIEKIESTKELNTSLDPQTIQFYPNPSDGKFTLQFKLENQGDTKITVRDLEGEIVYEENISSFQGNYEKVIDIGKEAKGTYLINIIQGKNYATKQIIIQ